VIWATLENELPKQQRYVEACQELSFASQQAVMMIAQQFRDMDPEGGSQPPTPSGGASGFRSPLISGAMADRRRLNSDLPDFLEVGLDAESRFRRLKEHYIMLKEDQERWEEERASLRWEVEAERGKRQEAEEAERMARAELRLAEEVRDRGKEDQRAIFEIRLEREVASCREELRLRDREAEALREELDLARVQAKTAQRLASQLEMFKKKIEECQSWKREKEDLRQQLDELMSSRPGRQRPKSQSTWIQDLDLDDFLRGGSCSEGSHWSASLLLPGSGAATTPAPGPGFALWLGSADDALDLAALRHRGISAIANMALGGCLE
ncbi:unnamed protein product, partial [Polarella glacialis]